MDSKLSILLFLTTLAGSSLAVEKGSCGAETKIGASSAKIKRAQDTLIEGLAKVAKFINDVVLAILADKSEGLALDSETAESRLEAAERMSLAAFSVGIPPTLEAIAIFQTKLDISGNVDSLQMPLKRTNEIIWLAVKAVRDAENYSESRSALGNFATSVQVTTRAAIDGLFDAMLKGTAVIPKKAKGVITCLRSQATSALLNGAVAGIFNELNILLEAIFKAKSQPDFDKYSSQIAAAHKGVGENLHHGVIHTVSLLRNLLSE